ncbi:DUF924 family protein [Croceibacterium aestuarii]|uniref:DUF924 family protein n=1 Tax=Croceibacterium aestuarii TaxID=3064139 RepID=UPI00272DD859|nr:DUF924 family protein [Croceibacterium sp. D39]
MAAARRPWAADLLHFWFHHLGPADWFASDPALDRELARRFGRWWDALRRRPASDFLGDAYIARGAVLLFDQIPRNLHRQSALAFTSDPLARAIAKGALERGWDTGLGLHERQFLAMPLMHSEDRRDQIASVRFFAELGDSRALAFARAHRRMIARFGRFPHRNAVLGRAPTALEQEAIAAGFAW